MIILDVCYNTIRDWNWCIMKTIIYSNFNEINIKNSRFISLIYKVSSVEEVNNYLNNVKRKYPNATHYCYAYIIDNVKKSSDDNEPGGTAGTPMLQVLEKNDLNNVLVITVRYFGGIKLGAGGLVRAYTKSVTEVLKLCELKELVKGVYIKITFSYDYVKDIDYILKDIEIEKKDYNEQISYYFNCSYNLLDSLKKYNYLRIDILDKDIYL